MVNTRKSPPVEDFAVVSALNACSGVPDTSAIARIMPAAPSATALGAFFDSVADLKSALVFDSIVILPPSDAIAEAVGHL